jgi:tetratricopeptide (TPR) repeat protein
MRGFHQLIDAYNQSSSLSSEQLAAVARACWALGADDPQLFKDALKAFDEAIAADPDNIDARVGLVSLFLEKYNRTDAATAAEGGAGPQPVAPRSPPGHGARARCGRRPRMLETLERSLKVNPAFEPARVFLAEVRLDQEDYEAAARESRRCSPTTPLPCPRSPPWPRRVTSRAMHRAYEDARRRALALGPRNAELYNRLAELSARNRLYRQAADFAQQAVALDPRTWRGPGHPRPQPAPPGQVAEGRTSLEASFKGDPYNVWIKNTLDLLDTFPNTRRRGPSTSRSSCTARKPRCSRPYTAELAEDAYAHLSARYGYRPDGPVRVEVYPITRLLRAHGGPGRPGRPGRVLRPRARHRLARPRARSDSSTGARPCGTRSRTRSRSA